MILRISEHSYLLAMISDACMHLLYPGTHATLGNDVARIGFAAAQTQKGS
jgi:hypothetical protein